MHDVGAAEALRVLEGSGVEDVAGLEVDEVHGDGGGTDVGGDAEDAAAVTVDDAWAVGSLEDDLVAFADGERVEFDVGAVDRLGEDAWLATEDVELDVGLDIDDCGLAGEAIVFAQEVLGVGERIERVHAASDFDDAFVALAGPAAGCRHAHGEIVGVVEEGLSGLEGEGRLVVDKGH